MLPQDKVLEGFWLVKSLVHYNSKYSASAIHYLLHLFSMFRTVCLVLPLDFLSNDWLPAQNIVCISPSPNPDHVILLCF